MSPLVKLAGFAAILVAVFGAAVAAGDVLGPDREGAAEQRAKTSPHGAATHESSESHPGEGEHGAADPIRGLSVREDGLELALARTQLPRGRSTELRFSVRDADGPVKDFEVTHEKRMHVIVVRRDGRGFQHLHPELDARGNWTTRITLPDAGAYRVFADFQREGEAYTLAADLSVDGAADYRAFPRPSAVDRTDGYAVRLNTHGSELSFDITRDGQPVKTEPYLGAGGHLVALREGDLAFLHVHPNGDGVAFEADLERGSRYHLFLQFQHGGRVHTAEFTR